jgi:hypothetical protein
VLDAGCHHDIVYPRGNLQSSEVHGLLTRAAPHIDGGRSGRLRQALGQPGVPSDPGRLLSHLVHAPGDNALDRRRLDPDALDEPHVALPEQVDRVDAAEHSTVASSTPDRCADRPSNDHLTEI